MCSEHISSSVGYAELRGFWENLHRQKFCFLGKQKQSLPLSELVKMY
jgi:hypothetical protein